MKFVYVLLVATAVSLSAVAQGPKNNYSADNQLGRWVIDVNLLGGASAQNFTTANSVDNYPNALNANTGNLKFKNGAAFGADAQLGFFFGEQRHWGIGTGFMYLMQQGNAALDNFHIEYQSTDAMGSVFRQLITGNDVREYLNITNLNIPIVLKYKNRFSKRWGFTADAGLLVNLQMKNDYTTHGTFDYEAIYQLVKQSDGATVSVYDNSPTPSVNDWLITKADFLRTNPEGNMQDYFNTKRALGFKVGLNEPAGISKGTVSYQAGSIGFMLQPSFNYFLSDHVALNLGLFYSYQMFKKDALGGYRLTDGSGNYSSVLNNVTASADQTFALNIGARFFFGRKSTPLTITSIAPIPPSQCGSCDGSLAINGLPPGKEATIVYSVNGAQPVKYTATVQPDGQVKIPNLCAGNYTGIVASIRKKSATGTPVILSDPPLNISAPNTSNPSAQAICDGSARFDGLYAGKPVVINYKRNDSAQPAFTGIVNQDNSVTMTGLCEGTYTGVVANINNCSAIGTDFTLTAPAPPPPPPPAVTAELPTVEKIDISTPILFELNKAVVHSSSYPVLDEAAEELKENKRSYITIDGHADTTGPESFNRVLSLRRANAVKHQLVKRGINPKRLKTKGHGSSMPAADNSTAEGRRQNRRAVMTMHTPKSEEVIGATEAH